MDLVRATGRGGGRRRGGALSHKEEKSKNWYERLLLCVLRTLLKSTGRVIGCVLGKAYSVLAAFPPWMQSEQAASAAVSTLLQATPAVPGEGQCVIHPSLVSSWC